MYFLGWIAMFLVGECDVFYEVIAAVNFGIFLLLIYTRMYR